MVILVATTNKNKTKNTEQHHDHDINDGLAAILISMASKLNVNNIYTIHSTCIFKTIAIVLVKTNIICQTVCF